MRRSLPLFLLLAASAPAQDGLFTFRSELWPNLHHFLYVLGRARNATPDSKRDAVRHVTEDVEGMDALEKAELIAWDAAITQYQHTLSRKDAVFDADLVAITRTLSSNHLGVPDELRRTLESVAPIYRKVWWARHDRTNQARIREMQALLREHGQPIAAFVAKAWGQPWPPEGRVVQVCAYSNWAGAYSTTGGLVVISSLDAGTSGSAGLETLFHEAMHQWDDDFQAVIARVASRVHATVPRTLSHSLIFYTAGFAVSREIQRHKPYADTAGVWQRGLFSRQRIEAEWAPYLKGQRTMEEALEKLLTAG
jgi:hypothetical protein